MIDALLVLDNPKIEGNLSRDLSIKHISNDEQVLNEATIEAKKEILLVSESVMSPSPFLQRGFIANEKWKSTKSIEARINRIEKKVVYCDCLIDKEKRIFQQRRFNFDLFSHLPFPLENKFIIIKTRTKPGAVRMDILNGKGIVEEEFFNLNNDWEKIDQLLNTKPFNT